MSRHILSLSDEQLTAFDLDTFVAPAEILNQVAYWCFCDTHMQEPDIPPLFQTISKAESPLSFFGDEVPTEAISDKSYWTKPLRGSFYTAMDTTETMFFCIGNSEEYVHDEEDTVT